MVQAIQSPLQDNSVSNIGIEGPQVESRYSYVNSFFEKGCQKFNQGLDFVKSHKLATIGALAVGAIVFFIYAERDKHASSALPGLAEPLERLSGHCMTDICENTENLREALKTNDLVKILAVKGPFRSHPNEKIGDSGMGLGWDFNKAVGQAFFNNENKRQGKYVASVLDFFKHPYFAEHYLYEQFPSSQPLGDLAIKDFENLLRMHHWSKEKTITEDFAKELKIILDQIALEKQNTFPYTMSLHPGPLSSFFPFLKYLQDETGVQFNFYGDNVEKLSSKTPDQLGAYKKYLRLPYNARKKEVTFICHDLLIHLRKHKGPYFDEHPTDTDKWFGSIPEDSADKKLAKIRIACENLQWRKK